MNELELRLGNLLHYSSDKKLARVSSLGSNGFETTYIDRSRPNGSTDITDYSPIPLTEEWLVKFGFGKVIGWFITTKPNISLELSENNDNSTKQWYCYVRNTNGIGIQDDFCLLRKDLMYVHQIQNLYFDLKGEELNPITYPQK